MLGSSRVMSKSVSVRMWSYPECFVRMKMLLLLPVLVSFYLLVGCGVPKADLSTPRTYRSGDITFDYPKNWKVTDESVTSDRHCIFVDSPGDALIILQSRPADWAGDLTAFCKSFSESSATELTIGRFEQIKITNLPDAAGYSWVVEDFEIDLLGESVPHQRFYGTKSIGGKQYYLVLQVPTGELLKVEAGFHLIRDSLRSSQKLEEDAVENR